MIDALYLEVKLTLQLQGWKLISDNPSLTFTVSKPSPIQNWPAHRVRVNGKDTGVFAGTFDVTGSMIGYRVGPDLAIYIWMAEDHWYLVSTGTLDREGNGLATFCQALKEVLDLD